jgi:DNA polymerase-1
MIEFNEEYPDLSDEQLIAIDIETYDPNLIEKGAGVYRRDGFILGVSVATDTFANYYNLGHYDCNEALRAKNAEYIRHVMALPVNKLGANIMYDVDWLQNWIEFNTDDYRRRSIHAPVNGKWYDIQVAEPLINENQKSFSLDTLAKKYLGKGKYKTEIDKFCEECGYKGDARKYLYKMPYPLQIFKAQLRVMEEEGLLEVFDLETRLLPAVMHMRYTGAIIDDKQRDANARQALKSLEEAKKRLDKNYGAINYNSTKQLATLLDKAGIDYEYKLSYTNKDGIRVSLNILSSEAASVLRYMNQRKYATPDDIRTTNRLTNMCADAVHTCNPTIPSKFLESLEERLEVREDSEDSEVEQEDNPYSQVVEDILFCRKADKILNTFLVGSLRESVSPDGRIHPTILTLKGGDNSSGLSGTITGRFSMKNPNLQQIPSKGKNKYWGNMCRECFVPEKDHWFAKVDYSQVEYRILAHYAMGAGADHLRETYNDDPNTDYHQYIQDMTDLERSYAKNLNFGCMYGMGLYKMMLTFGWTREFSEEVLQMYHGSAPYIKYTMNKVASVAERRGYIRTISGRHAHVESKDKLYKMLNKLIQGSAADIMKKAMVDIYEDENILNVLKWHITVHDELDVSIPKTVEGVKALFRMKYLMENAYTLKVPLKAEIEIGSSWASVGLLEFDVLQMDRKTHAQLLPYFKEEMTKNYAKACITQDKFIQRLRETSVEHDVELYSRICEDVVQAKKQYNKVNGTKRGKTN